MPRRQVGAQHGLHSMKRTLTFLPSGLNLDGGRPCNITDGAELFNTSCPTIKVTLTLQSAPGAELFNTSCPTIKVTLTLQSAPGASPRVYLYKIEAVDGRQWKQTITFDALNNPLMTFNMPDSWRFSEFSQQRDLRDSLVSCALAYPTLEKITYDFT